MNVPFNFVVSTGSSPTVALAINRIDKFGSGVGHISASIRMHDALQVNAYMRVSISIPIRFDFIASDAAKTILSIAFS